MKRLRTGSEVAGEEGTLTDAAAVIAEMDSVFARGRFAREFDACIPEFSEVATIALTDGPSGKGLTVTVSFPPAHPAQP